EDADPRDGVGAAMEDLHRTGPIGGEAYFSVGPGSRVNERPVPGARGAPAPSKTAMTAIERQCYFSYSFRNRYGPHNHASPGPRALRAGQDGGFGRRHPFVPCPM